MPIRARTQKTGVATRILVGSSLEVVDDLALAVLPRHIQIPRQPILGGDHGKQIVDGGRADFSEHLLAFGRRFR